MGYEEDWTPIVDTVALNDLVATVGRQHNFYQIRERGG